MMFLGPNPHVDDLLECEECLDSSGRIYNNADPKSGQWVECPNLFKKEYYHENDSR
jgi:hypothetical protein